MSIASALHLLINFRPRSPLLGGRTISFDLSDTKVSTSSTPQMQLASITSVSVGPSTVAAVSGRYDVAGSA